MSFIREWVTCGGARRDDRSRVERARVGRCRRVLEASTADESKSRSEHSERVEKREQHSAAGCVPSMISATGGARQVLHADHPKTRLSVAKNPGADEELRAEAAERSTANAEAELSDSESLEKEVSPEYVDDPELEVEEFGLKSETEDWWSGSMYDADREEVDVDAEKRRSRKPVKMPVVGAEGSYAGRRSMVVRYRRHREHASQQNTPAP